MRLALTVFFAGLLSAADSASAELFMPRVFGDHMVFQRDEPVPVFGKAEPGAKIVVEFAGQAKQTTAGKDGAWRVELDPMPASTAGRGLGVRGDGRQVFFEDVLVGEVWVCSGQSNMVWPVDSSVEAELEIVTANRPHIRLLHVRQATSATPQDDVSTDRGWEPCTPDSVRKFSAVGYFFGRALEDALGVPVGLIDTNWGGTRAEAWTPPAAMTSNPELKPILDTWAERTKGWDPERAKAQHETQLAAWEPKWKAFRAKQKAGDIAPGARPPRKPQLAGDPDLSRHNASRLWNAMVNGLVPFNVRGAIWYQGESNAGRAKQYRPLMKTMIQGWRDAWGKEFPFYQVQLANFMAPQENPGESAWAELREAQDKVSEEMAAVGKAVITDIGAEKDIHPKDKQNVGKRLARLALTDVYGLEITREGPQFDSATFEDGQAVVSFESKSVGVGPYRGLETYYRQPLRGFAIAGEDKQWKWAEAKIIGETVVVSHPGVKEPAAVRYNWSDNPNGTLQNRAGLPAEPFRSDDWPGVTDNNVTP